MLNNIIFNTVAGISGCLISFKCSLFHSFIIKADNGFQYTIV